LSECHELGQGKTTPFQTMFTKILQCIKIPKFLSEVWRGQNIQIQIIPMEIAHVIYDRRDPSTLFRKKLGYFNAL
jgi:hypothetical protein